MNALRRRLSLASLSSDSKSFAAVDQYKGNKHIMKEIHEAAGELQEAVKAKVAAEKKFLEVVAKLKLWMELVRDEEHQRALAAYEQEKTVNLDAKPPADQADNKHVDAVAQFLTEENTLILAQEAVDQKFQQLLIDPIPQILDKEFKLVPKLINKYARLSSEFESIQAKVVKARAENSPKLEKLEQEMKTARDSFDEARIQLKIACDIVRGREEEMVQRLSAYLFVQTEFYAPKSFGGKYPEVAEPAAGLFGALPLHQLPQELQRVEAEPEQAHGTDLEFQEPANQE